MPKAEKGTPKAIANAMKSKGLQKLRWYCQVCEKQCRDENGFKCHMMSESHLRQMLVVGENAGSYINDYSRTFMNEFIALLSRRWGTKRVRANQVYQEYIADKHHSHMNATKWVTLTEFVKHLGREGVCHVDETEKGWFISWIDSSPKALAKQDAAKKKERQDMDDEERQRRFIAEQIERAKKEAEAAAAAAGGTSSGPSTLTSTSIPSPPQPQGMEGTGGDGEEIVAAEVEKKAVEPVKLSLAMKKSVTAAEPPKQPSPPSTSTDVPPSTSTSASFSVPNPLKISNPLKRTNQLSSSSSSSKPNPLKSSSSTSSSAAKAAGKQGHSLSAVEQIFQEEQDRKRRREQESWSKTGYGREGLSMSGGHGGGAGGGGGKRARIVS